MNRFEDWFCSSRLWRMVTERKLLPWVLSGYALGEHVLEVGSGPGATTEELLRRAGRVTSLEYDAAYASQLAVRYRTKSGARLTVVRGDAAALPFPDNTFSSVVAVLVLHHLRSRELQDRAFQEIHRVLRPGGNFFAFEVRDGWLHRVGHYHSTFVPVAPASAFARLTVAGFSRIAVDIERSAFRLCASRAAEV
ncbi:MAG TPA: class I SAM-dependent methyltransferase [Dongiaceae bacterium]|nr:class I SAM-dependent methyltransferase [Dongiaceae bacterium]